MMSPGCLTSIREGSSGRGVRAPGSRSRPRIAVERLEPRFLLSLNVGGRPVPPNVPAVAPLRIVDVGPVVVDNAPGAATDAGSGDPSATTQQAVESSPLAVEQGQMASPDDPATVQIPDGASPYLVTFRLLSPQAQATWSLFVRDRYNREIGSVTVPQGQGGVTFAILSTTGAKAGPITLTVAADRAHLGHPAGAFVLEVESALPPANPSPPAVASDDTAFFFIGMTADANEFLAEGPPSHPAASPGAGIIAAGASAAAPPSGATETVYPKPAYGGGGVRKAVAGDPTSEEELAEASDSESDPERTGQDGAIALGDFPEVLDPASSGQQRVDAPGGLPGTDAVAEPRRILARRLAEEGRLSHPGNRSGQVVISALVAAGLIVPNVLILGAPRFRPSRLRWRRVPQRRTSPSAAD
jgi:hypothetical protein